MSFRTHLSFRRATLGAGACVALILAQAPLASGAPPQDAPVAGHDLGALAQGLAAKGLEPTRILRELQSAGPGVLESLLRHPDLDARGRRRLRSNLRLLPAEVVRQQTSGTIERDAHETFARVALEVTRELAEAKLAGSALAAAAPFEGERRLSKAVASDLDSTVHALLERAENAREELRRNFDRLHLAVQARVVRATGAHRSPTALALLLDLHYPGQRFELALLSQISRCASDFDPALAIERTRHVRASLESPQSGVRREAALALGHLDDQRAVPALIALLNDEAPVSENAHWALTRLSGLGMRPDQQRWEAWHATEMEWMRERAPEFLAALDHGPSLRVFEALHEIAFHRLFRDELAPALIELFDDRNPKIVRDACHAAGNLRATRTASAIAALLGHEDEGVRAAAWKALRSITGLSLPAEVGAWMDALP